MDTVHTRGPAIGATPHERSSRDPEEVYRARIGEIVEALWSAHREGQLRAYLEPIPVTRLYAAQRALREIGAVRAANILRSALFSLTRVRSPADLSQVVAEMAALLDETTDDVNGLATRFLAGRVRRTSSATSSDRGATTRQATTEHALRCEEDRRK